MELTVKLKKMHVDAKTPTYSTEHSAGFDFYSVDNVKISKENPQIIRTGVSVEIPNGYVMLLFSRSGHGFKNNVRLSNCVGVIDSDFRAEVLVKLAKDDIQNNEFHIDAGDRIAQGIIIPFPKIIFEEATSLSETNRGENGFGSTGR